MAVQGQEYANLLTVLSPDTAITVLNDRVALISKVNNDIADWLQERKKVEEAYAAGLRKLARRPQQDGAVALGIFQMPWQRIVSGTENLAQSHESLAQRIEADVENPLRQFSSKNRAMQNMSTVQGNLATIAKDYDKAQQKAAKGGRRADAASSSVDESGREWDSQAPYVFEQLQSLDEVRLNHLRDVLTQFQTHEVDLVEKHRVSAESCLNALLNIETADEIKTFATRVRQQPLRRPSTARPSSSSTGVPPTPPPPRGGTDRLPPRQNSAIGRDTLPPLPIETPEKKRFGGIKRFGTVLNRRKDSVPTPPTTERKRDRRSFAPFRRGDSSRSFQDLEEQGADLSPIPSSVAESRSTQQPGGIYEIPTATTEDVEDTADITSPASPPIMTNGTSQVAEPVPPVNNAVNDYIQGGQLQEPLQPQELSAAPASPETHHMYSDPILRAQQEAGLAPSANDDVPRSLQIRDQPIQEDTAEAQRAMDDMANRLRMQAQTSASNRAQGTVRGRRDVRNTIYLPSATDNPANSSIASQFAPISVAAALGASTGAAQPGFTPNMASPIASPTLRAGTPGAIPEDRAIGSDTTSLHSAQSLSAATNHPDLSQPGLNASIVETVSTWFGESGITKSLVTGEIAFACLPSTTGVSSDEKIRIQNFPVLEKVAVNPTFLKTARSSMGQEEAGIYEVAVSAIKRPTPTVGLKYQAHIDESNIGQFSPILIRPAWQTNVEGQVSAILFYSLNPAFVTGSATTSEEEGIVLKNVAITVALDLTGENVGRPTQAMMVPNTGTSFARKRGAVTWRMPEMRLTRGEEKLAVRIILEGGSAKRGTVDVKFDCLGQIPSGLGVERLVEAGTGTGRDKDPFADEGEGEDIEGSLVGGSRWDVVPVVGKVVAGRYTAS